MDAANLIKPALARGELHCVGATTLDEYRKYVEKDAALARRFQPVFVDEPDVADTISILRGIKEKYELHHGIRISDSALVASANLSNRYITDRFLPDKAIDALDEVGSRVHLTNINVPQEILDIVEIGLQHEQQHQELLMYDIKYIFGNQPAFPVLDTTVELKPETTHDYLTIKEGLYEIGHKGKDFCFDNEQALHKVYIHNCEISKSLVTNGEYLEFIEADGYSNFNLWHADGWDWVQNNNIQAPMYWHRTEQGYK